MRQLLCKIATLCATTALMMVPPSLEAASITLSTPEPTGVVGTGGWEQDAGGFRITSEVTSNGGVSWHYMYHITSNTWDEDAFEELSKDLSFFTFQVSEGFTMEEIIIDGTFSANVATNLQLVDLDPDKNNASVEGLPDDLHGIKVELNENSGELWFEFDSYRNPILGSFYAKDGKGTYAYNTGLDPNAINGQFIIVPDTVPIPEPATWLILSSCLGMAARGRRKKKMA